MQACSSPVLLLACGVEVGGGGSCMCVGGCLPAFRSSQATQRGLPSRHRSSHTTDSRESHLQPRNGFGEWFYPKPKEPRAWVAPAAASPHMHVGIIGFPVKPQALGAGKDYESSEANESLKTLLSPASAAAPRSREEQKRVGSLQSYQHGKLARAPGGAGHLCWGPGTCLLCPQRWGWGGGRGGSAGLP